MATKKDLRSSPKRDLRARGGGRPGRPLLFILVAMAALTSAMFLSGYTTPRLGIDLAGGTSITLEAVAEDGKEDAINPTNLKTAVAIIERRVNGLGVQEAEVQTQGDRNIIVNIPRGSDEQEARDQVGTTAELGFRPVNTTQPVQQQSTGGQDGGDNGGDGGDGGDNGGDGKGDTQEGDSGEGQQEGDGGAEGQTGETGEETGGQGGDNNDEGDDQSNDQSNDQSLPAPGGTGATTGLSPASYTTQEQDGGASEGGDGGDDGDTKGDGQDAGDGGSGGASGGGGGGGKDEPRNIYTDLENLDCSTEKARLRASRAAASAPDSEQVVACDKEGLTKYVLDAVAVPGTDVSDADAVFDTQQGQGWIVQMEFTNSGADKFADVTEFLATQIDPMNRFAIVLDGEVVSAPSVSQRLGGGRAEIYGSFSQGSAEDLANILKYGALPLNFQEASVSTVSPTLGGEQLRAGLIAGAIGLILVVLYLVLYYRGLSLIAFASLMVSAVLTYTIMSLLGPAIGFALNLPAVCGAIVAIGITADSFIVYFERIRDEVREGRTLRPAVERAWPRARRTILVSDFVSFLAAAVLFVVTVGKVQGFAFTLGLTTLLDVVVVFLFTKPLMTILARRRFFSNGHPWSGLDPKRLGARTLRGGRRPVPVPSDPKEA